MCIGSSFRKLALGAAASIMTANVALAIVPGSSLDLRQYNRTYDPTQEADRDRRATGEGLGTGVGTVSEMGAQNNVEIKSIDEDQREEPVMDRDKTRPSEQTPGNDRDEKTDENKRRIDQ